MPSSKLSGPISEWGSLYDGISKGHDRIHRLLGAGSRDVLAVLLAQPIPVLFLCRRTGVDDHAPCFGAEVLDDKMG